MTSPLRMSGALIILGLLFSPTSPSGASPDFSDWTVPTNLGPTVNSSFQDFGPAVSKDGLSLFFSSDRPGGFGSFDTWVSQRATEDDAWGPPENLGGVINTAAGESVPALSRDGHWLFFTSDADGFGGLDIWASWRQHTHDDFGWGPPFNLGASVNSAFFDANPTYFENGGRPLLFFTSNRPGGPGAFDVYVSRLAPNGRFGPAVLVPELSSPDAELRLSVRFDGLEMFFHQNPAGTMLTGDLWVSTRDTVNDPWSAPLRLGATVNTMFADQQPYIATDRRTLFIVSNRPGGFGGLDLYVTTRTKERPRKRP